MKIQIFHRLCRSSFRWSSTVKRRTGESGYTLLETLVAMSLFVSVLIPLGATIGNLMLDDTSASLTSALRAAESAMSRTTVNRNFVDTTEVTEQGLTLSQNVERMNNLVGVRIAVYSRKEPRKILLTLSKKFLVYR